MCASATDAIHFGAGGGVGRVGMWLCCRDEAGTSRPCICDVEACVISQRPARHPLADVAWRFHDLPNCAIFLPDRSFIVRGTFSWPELVERWLHTIGVPSAQGGG